MGCSIQSPVDDSHNYCDDEKNGKLQKPGLENTETDSDAEEQRVASNLDPDQLQDMITELVTLNERTQTVLSAFAPGAVCLSRPAFEGTPRKDEDDKDEDDDKDEELSFIVTSSAIAAAAVSAPGVIETFILSSDFEDAAIANAAAEAEPCCPNARIRDSIELLITYLITVTSRCWPMRCTRPIA